jgi:hypothetical protein
VGIGCVLFFWVIVAAAGLVIATVGAVIFFRSTGRASGTGTLSGALIGAVGATIAMGAILFVGGWLFWGMRPHETTSRDAYQEAFGSPASGAVTEIRSQTTDSTDSHEQFLRFHAPRSTLAAIVDTRFKRSTSEECRQKVLQWSDEAPTWWKPSATPQAECYTAEPYDHLFASTSAWLLYDGSTSHGYFHYLGVD